MKNRKPAAHFFIEGDGMATYRCPTKEIALKAMLECWNDDLDWSEENYGKDGKPTLDKIVEERYYTHKSCGEMTIGSQDCWDCGEPCGTNGRKTYVIYFSSH